MTIFASAEHRTVNRAAGDCNDGILHVGLLVEEYAWVTLAATEEVAGHGVGGNLTQSAGHTDCSARHHNGTYTGRIDIIITNVRHLVTAIDVGQDVSTGDFYPNVAAYGTGPVVPFTRTVRIFTAATAEHVAVVGVSVATGWPSSFRRRYSGA